MRVLHIIPDSVLSPRDRYLGTTKDARGRTEYFAARGIRADELVAEGRDDVKLRTRLQSVDLDTYDAILCELVLYPRTFQYLHNHPVRPRLLVRPINAEFFHRLHYSWAEDRAGAGRSLASWAALRLAFYRLHQDIYAARRADTILSITPWETENYWSRLTNPRRIRTVPYFLPREFLDTPMPAATKKNHCVCMLSSKYNAFVHDLLMRFDGCVTGLGTACPEWDFLVTGALPATGPKCCSRLQFLGFLDSPDAALREARAVAILSDYGFGFKTKVLDAIQHQCYILVTRRLLERLPPVVRPFCRIVDRRSPTSFQDALASCRQPYAEGDPNRMLRDQAFQALDECLGLTARADARVRRAS